MGNLFTSLLNTANALRVYDQALAVTQNNVTNASTPGFVKQTQSVEAMPFDIVEGLPGGVEAGPVLSARDRYAEQAVRAQQNAVGLYGQKTSDLTPLQTYFDLAAKSGLAPSISGLFQSFSQLSVNPNDTASRQAVLQQANQVAENFQHTATGLLDQGTDLGMEADGSIESINHLAGVIAAINAHNRVDPTGVVDAGVDAQLHAALEELAQEVNFTALEQPDHTVALYIGGQTPLVVKDQVYAIQGDFTASQSRVLNSSGIDITAEITGGKLAGLLDDKNNVIPSYLADLNTLAQSVADQVNAALANGLDQNGAAPATDLFHYDAAAGAAITLAVNPLTPGEIAAASPGAPGGNGNALQIAALADARNLTGLSFAQFYGNLGGRIGRDVSTATGALAAKQQLLSQAQALRANISGVSLNEEAEHMIALQRSYEAVSKMLGIINSITDTLMSVIH